jgi:hypothetical protein
LQALYTQVGGKTSAQIRWPTLTGNLGAREELRALPKCVLQGSGSGRFLEGALGAVPGRLALVLQKEWVRPSTSRIQA